MAFIGHTFTQQPQATQVCSSTKAFLFFLAVVSNVCSSLFDLYRRIIADLRLFFCDFVTEMLAESFPGKYTEAIFRILKTETN